jgi:alkanesulfonate monooxygenase SsuD/methylene tetrahydromethanopterin reductase-like flavin-dependent oxidoreductase (luciferase family)
MAKTSPFPAEVPMRRELFVAPTRAEAIRRTQTYLEEKYQAYRAWGQGYARRRRFRRRVRRLVARGRFLLGSSAEVADRLDRLSQRAGVNHIVVSVYWPGMPNSLGPERLNLLAQAARGLPPRDGAKRSRQLTPLIPPATLPSLAVSGRVPVR